MSSRATAASVLLLIASLAPLAAHALSADEKEIAAYKLTMPTVKKVAAVSRALAEDEARDPQQQEITKVTAEIDALEQKGELTEAEEARLEKLRERLDALEEEQDRKSAADKSTETLDGLEARLKQHQGAAAVLAREGLSAREWAVCMMALLQASLVEGFSQGKADLAKLPPGVNPDNVRFVREHRAELEAMREAFGGKRN